MYKDFEGRTEQEAIDKAVEELGLDRNDFNVEILEKEKKGLFRKGNVKIRVYFDEDTSSSAMKLMRKKRATRFPRTAILSLRMIMRGRSLSLSILS